MFNGQVMSWTTQDSQAPRIGLGALALPADPPETRAKAPWKRPDLVGWQLARVFHRVVMVVDRARHVAGKALVTLAVRPPPTPGRGLGVHHHYSR